MKKTWPKFILCSSGFSCFAVSKLPPPYFTMQGWNSLESGAACIEKK